MAMNDSDNSDGKSKPKLLKFISFSLLMNQNILSRL